MNTKENKKECEGSCIELHGTHKGEVKEVYVISYEWPPMTFFYCENAIEEDRRRGFVVNYKHLTE